MIAEQLHVQRCTITYCKICAPAHYSFFWTAWRSYVNSMIEEIIVSCDGSGGSASIGDEESSQYSGLIAWGGVVGTLLLLLALRRLKRHFFVRELSSFPPSPSSCFFFSFHMSSYVLISTPTHRSSFRRLQAPPVTLIYNKRQPGNVIQTMLPMMKALKRGQYNHRC